MPLYKPGTENLYESGLDNLIQALLNRNAVVHGGNECLVQAHAAPDMGVRVLTGTIQGNATRVAVAQTDLVVAANPGTNGRVDNITLNFTTGVPAITAGVAAATPKPPSLAATDILLAHISVPPAAVNIQAANISDRRLFLPTYEDVLALGAPPNPNLALNSDFGRRTVFSLAMPEAFADTAGYARIDGGTAPGVAANILTQGAAGNEEVWGGASLWRDGRYSATFKAVSTSGEYGLEHFIDSNNKIIVRMLAGVLRITKVVAGTPTEVANVSQALTLNRWYWLQLDKQGTTIVASVYDTGGTASGVTKAASTLLQSFPGTVADAALNTAGRIGIYSDQATAQWGGVAASPGGVYVETWLPESYVVGFGGTLGGQAIGFDESADAGPLAKQWALRAYIPATNRTASVIQSTADGTVVPSTTYAGSFYYKASGYGGSGGLLNGYFYEANSALTLGVGHAASITGNAASWTRTAIASWTNAATARRAQIQFQINEGATATGTVSFSLPQLEQGATATGWRNAPEDVSGQIWELRSALSGSTTSAGMTETNSADLGGIFFLPRDSNVLVEYELSVRNSVAGNVTFPDISVDGANLDDGIGYLTAPVAAYNVPLRVARRVSLAAGKHRISAILRVTAGTTTWGDRASRLIVTAYSGK